MWDWVRIGFLIFVCLVVAYRTGYRDGANKMLDVLLENPDLYAQSREFMMCRERAFPELKEAREKLEKEENHE